MVSELASHLLAVRVGMQRLSFLYWLLTLTRGLDKIFLMKFAYMNYYSP
jgi:hypothetical protein